MLLLCPMHRLPVQVSSTLRALIAKPHHPTARTVRPAAVNMKAGARAGFNTFKAMATPIVVAAVMMVAAIAINQLRTGSGLHIDDLFLFDVMRIYCLFNPRNLSLVFRNLEPVGFLAFVGHIAVAATRHQSS